MNQTYDRWLDIPLEIRNRLKHTIGAYCPDASYSLHTEHYYFNPAQGLIIGMNVLVRTRTEFDDTNHIQFGMPVYVVYDSYLFSPHFYWVARPFDDSEPALADEEALRYKERITKEIEQQKKG